MQSYISYGIISMYHPGLTNMACVHVSSKVALVTEASVKVPVSLTYLRFEKFYIYLALPYVLMSSCRCRPI